MTPNLGQGACQALEDAATMTTWTSPPATAFRDTLTWLLGKLAPASTTARSAENQVVSRAGTGRSGAGRRRC
jgi:hypothetical protein